MNLRQVRTKIKSIGNVKKITRAMQLVSAVKMKKAQISALEGRAYRDMLESIIVRISKKLNVSYSSLLSKPQIDVSRRLVILVSSNKGLCGSFHSNLYRELLKHFPAEKTDFVTVGKKGAMFLGKSKALILADYSSLNPVVEVSSIFSFAISQFLSQKYAEIYIYYNKFYSTFKSEVVAEKILPISVPDEKKVYSHDGEYLIEPSPEELIDPLLRSYVEDKLRNAVLSSQAVEHSLRMVSMKNATENATDVIYNLTLLGNKIRQSKITSELLDMITAQESVEAA